MPELVGGQSCRSLALGARGRTILQVACPRTSWQDNLAGRLQLRALPGACERSSTLDVHFVCAAWQIQCNTTVGKEMLVCRSKIRLGKAASTHTSSIGEMMLLTSNLPGFKTLLRERRAVTRGPHAGLLKGALTITVRGQDGCPMLYTNVSLVLWIEVPRVYAEASLLRMIQPSQHLVQVVETG